jgi:hypothetical protein
MTLFAYDYPLLGLFWSMLWFFLWVAWIVLLFRVIADIFRSRDMGGGAKALWVILVVLLPFLGVFVYLLARGHKMADRDIADARSQEAAFQSYVQDVAGSGPPSTADELSKLADLNQRGVLSDAEFQAQKAKLLV